MSNIPIIAKQQTLTITNDQLDAAIAEIRQKFPHDAELAKVSDAELKQKVAEFLKSKQTFTAALSAPPTDRVEAVAGIEDPCPHAIGVVVVDTICMVLGFVGLHVGNTGDAATSISMIVSKDLQTWLKLINKLKDADSLFDKATAIFSIGMAAHSADMFDGILDSIKDSMTPWDWAIAATATGFQLAALVLTDGAAFIAEVALNATAIAYVVSDSVKAGQACGS